MRQILLFLLCLCVASNTFAAHKYKHKRKHKRTHPKILMLPTLNLPKTNSTQPFMENEVFNGINNYRVSVGLPKLILNDNLSDIARNHSQRIASGIIPIIYSNGNHPEFNQRVTSIRNFTINAKIAENVGWNIRAINPSGSAIRGWLNSPHHYENIIGQFKLTGIGVAIDPHGSYIFTQLFVQEHSY